MASNRSGGSDVARWQRQQLQAAQREQRAAEAAAKAAQRDERANQIAEGKRQAEERTTALQQRTALLQRLLIAGLSRSAAIDVSRLRRSPREIRFDPGPLGDAPPRPRWEDFEPQAPGRIAGLLGGKAKYEAQVLAARSDFANAERAWQSAERARNAALASARAEHEARAVAERAACAEYNRRLDAHVRSVADRQREPVEKHLGQVLRRTPLPDDFPRRVDVAFHPEAEQALVQLQLPGTEVVPTVKAVRYVQSRGEYEEVLRPQREAGELYRDVVAQVALLAVRDLFDADEHLREVAFNGHVDTVNRATGQREYPCIVTLTVDRAKFAELVLDQVSPVECLRHLNAVVSPHPYALTPIKPILDFDLSKYSFVRGLDAVATLDHRPDLMDMGHGEFEHLVRQVFEAMGMKGWTTTASKDDGVDAVVVNPAPFVGGLTIVQAKHYKGVVGVNHIRELAGAMEEKKAGRGILITTSWFTSGGWQKSREHGRMELIDGPRLVHMIKEHVGKDVVIGVQRPKNAPTGPPESH